MTTHDEVSGWWTTAITRVAPGEILLRGYPVQQLIGNVSFGEQIWLMLRGDLPTPAQVGLLEAALVSGVDHGPQAPSIAAARMAATCGVGLNSAVATGAGLLGDVHGGAGQQCMELLAQITAATDPPADPPFLAQTAGAGDDGAVGTGSEADGAVGAAHGASGCAGGAAHGAGGADGAGGGAGGGGDGWAGGPGGAGDAVMGVARELVAAYRRERRHVPGFGHRLHHPRDPRRDPLIGLVGDAVEAGAVPPGPLRAGLALEAALAEGGRSVPMNVDGATAIVYASLGFPPELGRGLFVLSRSVGILAHAWEEKSGGRRIKGPLPKGMNAAYNGPSPRDLPH